MSWFTVQLICLDLQLSEPWEQPSAGVSMGVYHSFKDISCRTKVSGWTASQKLDHNEDRSQEKKVCRMWISAGLWEDNRTEYTGMEMRKKGYGNENKWIRSSFSTVEPRYGLWNACYFLVDGWHTFLFLEWSSKETLVSRYHSPLKTKGLIPRLWQWEQLEDQNEWERRLKYTEGGKKSLSSCWYLKIF